MNAPRIRPYRPEDRDEVARICLLTGAAGGDATGKFVDDQLLAHVYALPYVELEPGSAWVVDAGDHLAGYIICAPDTRAFVERYRDEWIPQLTALGYRDPGAPADGGWDLEHTAFHPEVMLIPEVDEYPAHLHIDVLPELQGQGFGRRLIATLLQALDARGIRMLHLTLDVANVNAQQFYAHLGFTPLPSAKGGPTPIGIATSTPL